MAQFNNPNFFSRLIYWNLSRMRQWHYKRSISNIFLKFGEEARAKLRWSRPGLFLALSGFSFQSSGASDDDFSGQGSFEAVKSQAPTSEWEPVYEGPNIKVLRRKLKDVELYEYRCFGVYDDISPDDFIDAQFDNDYRALWDENISSLEVLEQDNETDSQVVKWVSKFPYPMYHRLYIFVRRKFVDEEQRKIIVECKALDQKAYPDKSTNCVRITDYNSKLVVWAHKGFNEDGLSYLLTYRENPKSSIPSFAYNYMVFRTGPSFMDRVYLASKKLKAQSHRAEKRAVQKKAELAEAVRKESAKLEEIPPKEGQTDSEVNPAKPAEKEQFNPDPTLTQKENTQPISTG